MGTISLKRLSDQKVLRLKLLEIVITDPKALAAIRDGETRKYRDLISPLPTSATGNLWYFRKSSPVWYGHLVGQNLRRRLEGARGG